MSEHSKYFLFMNEEGYKLHKQSTKSLLLSESIDFLPYCSDRYLSKKDLYRLHIEWEWMEPVSQHVYRALTNNLSKKIRHHYRKNIVFGMKRYKDLNFSEAKKGSIIIDLLSFRNLPISIN